ncbi:MAG: hypothetical protein HC913_15105 [Microscillaceae bacterium]|nr:hypothetical protein [Microscillaceae bacterium]
MKIYPYLLIVAMVLLSTCTDTLPHQEKEEMGYRIENGQVVFEFDLRDYQQATQDGQHQVYDFRDLDVVEVAVAGEFNNWSKDGWKMRQIDDYRFQLRKKLKDFDGKFEWQYKFIVNEKYWVEPPVKARNQVEMYPGYRKSRNLVLNTEVPTPSLEGNTTFRLSGYPNARRVVLAGTFNQWNEKQLYFGQVEGEWICRVDLAPGSYEYKFIVDGEWITDPANPQKVQNEHGTFNSVLHHNYQSTTFYLEGFPNAQKVSIVGTFNQWNPAGKPAKK